MTRHARSMHRPLVWGASLGLGRVAVLLTSLVGPSAVLIGVPLLVGRERWVASSGFLSGFGLLWCALVVRQVMAGAEGDGLVLVWLGVSLVPILVGAVLAIAVALHRSPPHPDGAR